jgi:hypothetical protein
MTMQKCNTVPTRAPVHIKDLREKVGHVKFENLGSLKKLTSTRINKTVA